MMRSLHNLISRKRSTPPSQAITPGADPLKVNWIIPSQLAIGNHPQIGDGKVLAQAGVQVIVSLCAESEATLPPEITQRFHCLRYILPDSHYGLLLQVDQLRRIVTLIHQYIDQGKSVYVHCLAGIERSPTVCVAYLCCYQQLELWEAINGVRRVHTKASPTDEQLKVVWQLSQQWIHEQTMQADEVDLAEDWN